MAVKSLILGGNHSVLEMRADARGGHNTAKLVPAPSKNITLPVHERDRATRTPIKQLSDIRKCCVSVKHGACDQDHGDSRRAPRNRPDQSEHISEDAPEKPTDWAGRGFLCRRSFPLDCRVGFSSDRLFAARLGRGLRCPLFEQAPTSRLLCGLFAPFVSHQPWLFLTGVTHKGPLEDSALIFFSE